jgi:hypothetical protein
MPVKCVTGGLLFRTCNDLDWHIREEHLQERRRRPRARPSRPPRPWSVAPNRPTGRRHPRRGGYELGATAGEPPARPWWRRLFGRRPPEPPSGQGRGGA